MVRKTLRVLALVVALAPSPALAAPVVQSPASKVEAAITAIKLLDRPGKDNLAAAWDGNKYVQCRRMSDRALRCEAAGSLMQVSMAHVLTPSRIGQLAAMGWMLDPSFGNYVQTFRAEISAKDVADRILAALSEAYGADLGNLEVETTSIPSQACPPRNGPSQNLAGLISDASAMRRTAVYACAYRPASDEPAHKLSPGSTIADLIAVYGSQVTAEILRLRVNMNREHIFTVFDVGLGYIQCMPQSDPKAFYCEAQSADSWPALAAVLTPDRIARLHTADFADPGRAPNYSKTYPADQVEDAALAGELLTLLHDVYGYYGASKLSVGTEEGN
ncbi:hypothetical protein [Beijerinckia sp. L45]|uniref:TY-Chap domain-containing protein n=1 Tax=Beijerinckia sp. L45 TaxID=1641855 RepID=UPI001FEDF0A6|nr:hypothetical protein [Beijerinckia sp. L45]